MTVPKTESEEKKMKKIYDFGTIKASIERTSSGCFEVHVKDGEFLFKTMHNTEAAALNEILSYCETDDDFE